MRQQKAFLAVPLVVALGCRGQDDAQTANPSADEANTSAAERFTKADLGVLPNSSFTPRSQGARVETFIVELAGDPVARVVADAATAGVSINAATKKSTRASLAAAQVSVEAGVQSLGGSVKARYRDAYNGLRVRIASNQVAALQKIPGVVRVHRLQTFQPNNINGAQRVNAPGAWTPFAGVAGFRGEGIKVAIIDTGIDFTHADFGGPGTTEAYNEAFAAGALPADPSLFGPNAPKVKGGFDFAGDDYNANDPAAEIPAPDENPLDCGGHGTHVAGSTAGFGVLADGSVFSGPYNSSTYSANNFRVGPGVAPKADLYALRVFGCAGSTNLVVDALDWAVANEMDVVNMSLGSNFGEATDPSAVASDNAVRAGIVVVASAGNAGAVNYITGSPATSSLAISVAAQDPTSSYPGVALAPPGGGSIQTINANGAPVTTASLQVKVLLDSAGNISLGCSPADYVGVAGKLVVTKRGICARTSRAIYGEAAGAAAVLMVNNAAALPPYEGPITLNADTGAPANVTIPFLGTSLNNEALIKTLDGQVLALNAANIANPGFNALASFSSLGPRLSDGHLKPDVTAPGVSILSALVGSGQNGTFLSGTSMAAPHTAGLAALVRQAKPSWTAGQIKNAIVNTSSPGGVVNYPTRRAGAGVADATAAVRTQAIAWADAGEIHLNLGVLEQKEDYLQTKTIKVRNRGTTPVTFNLTADRPQGSPHTVALSPSSITVPANNTFSVNVTISIDTATSGNSTAFREAAGVITMSPTGGTNGGATLTVPYYGVLRPQANVAGSISPRLGSRWTQAYARVANTSTELSGDADFYAWGHDDANDGQGYADIRAAGVQSFSTGTAQLIVFAVNTYRPWSTPSMMEADVAIDTNLDGQTDYFVIGIDLGLLQGTGATGQFASALLNVATGAISVQYLGTAPTNGSTMLLPVTAAQLGLTSGSPRFAYSVTTFDLNSADSDSTNGWARFNAFSSAVSQGDYLPVAPGAIEYVPVSLDPAEQALTPALGHMIVTLDNKSGAREATLVPVRAE